MAMSSSEAVHYNIACRSAYLEAMQHLGINKLYEQKDGVQNPEISQALGILDHLKLACSDRTAGPNYETFMKDVAKMTVLVYKGVLEISEEDKFTIQMIDSDFFDNFPLKEETRTEYYAEKKV